MTTRSLGGQIVMIGTLIALLDKYYPSAEIEQHILKGIGRAKSILAQADIAADRGFATTDVDLLAEKIDIIAQRVGVYLQPEWAAKEGDDKNFKAVDADKAPSEAVYVGYTVPTGKTLFITQLGFSSHGHNAADRDKHQMCHGSIEDNTLSTRIWLQGGNGGGSQSFSKPIAIPEDHQVNFLCYNFANHNCDLKVAAGGYEV